MSRVIWHLPEESYINTMMPRHRVQHDMEETMWTPSQRTSHKMDTAKFATRTAAFIFEQVCLVVWGYYSYNTHISSVGRYFGLALTLFVDFCLVVSFVLVETGARWRLSYAALIALDLLCVPFLVWMALVVFFDTKPYDFERVPCERFDGSERCVREREYQVAYAPEFYLSIFMAFIHTLFMVTQCILCGRRAEPR